MKKKFKLVTLAVLLFGCALFPNVSVAEPVDVPLQIVDDRPMSNHGTHIPRRPLLISQDNNFLTLPATGLDYMLQLRYEDGMVVYSTFVPQGTTQIVLPSTLSGLYEIRLVADTYYYIGYIELLYHI